MSHLMDALAVSTTDSSPIFKFANSGDRIHGVIIEDPRLLPVTAFGTDAPKLDAAGQPVMQVMVVLATEQTQGDLHDGRWRVYIDKALMKQALYKAVKASGAEDLAIGDELTIEYTGKTVLSNSREAKAFTVAHSPAGVGSDAGTGAPF